MNNQNEEEKERKEEEEHLKKIAQLKEEVSVIKVFTFFALTITKW